MFVPIGGRIKIEDLLQGMIIQSGNDACVVLAEGLAGSEEAFVDADEQEGEGNRAQRQPFRQCRRLARPRALDDGARSGDAGDRTIKDFPEYYHYYGQMDYEFNNIKQGNRNPLLYKNVGADGLKTGHTEEAGFGLTASVLRGDRRIVVVLGGLPSMKARGQESERLIEWAFREFNDYRLFRAGDKVEDADVWLGAEARVPLTVAKDFVVTLPRKARKDMKVTAQYDRPIAAPIEAGRCCRQARRQFGRSAAGRGAARRRG